MKRIKTVLGMAEEWLPFYAGNARSVQELKKIDMCEVLWGLLSYDRQLEVERLAPEYVTVPTGSRIRLEYRQGADAPIVRVRLQECFGLLDMPRVDDGRLPVLMELLSPGYKAVQLTSDLRSFWSGTYYEVRKELRRRYPKHSWPDNPLEAETVRGVRKKKCVIAFTADASLLWGSSQHMSRILCRGCGPRQDIRPGPVLWRQRGTI